MACSEACQSEKSTRVLAASFIVSFALALCILGTLASTTALWDRGFFVLIPSGSYALFAGLVLLALSLLLNRFRLQGIEFNVHGGAAGVLLVFLSDWLTREYSFFQGPSIRGEIILASLLVALFAKKLSTKFWGVYLGLSVLALLSAFFGETLGRALSSDDHSTFLFRLALLKDNFPSIPFYYPLWNAGIDARDFFATGALNFFFFAYPLLQVLDLEKAYSASVALIVFLLTPLATYWACRISGMSKRAALIAAILSLSTGSIWYRWVLKYGTMGFVTTTALIPLNLAWANKLISCDENLSRKEALLFVLTFSLMLLWAPSGIAFVPLFGLALVRIRYLLKKRLLVAIAIGLVLINVPWMVILWKVSAVTSFMSAEQSKNSVASSLVAEDATAVTLRESVVEQPKYRHKNQGLNLKKSLRVLRETAQGSNPLLIFLGIAGLLLLRASRRIGYVLVCCWLLFLGTIAVPIKPQFELDRMLVILCFVLCAPAAMVLERLLDDCTSWWKTALASLCISFALVGPLSVSAILRNWTLDQYQVQGDIVFDMAKAIRDYGGDGRVVFSGFVLHELSGGHFAPLAVLSGKPLVASSPFHNKWWYTDVVPAEFLSKKDAGIEAFFDLMNASSLMTHESIWRGYFADRPDRYELVWRQGQFSLFKRTGYVSSYFQEGAGEILGQTTNSVVFRPQTERVVLRFTYFPFLVSSSCELKPYEAGGGVVLTEAIHCPIGEAVTLRSASVWNRVFGL